jgi:hypothetical protein
MELEVGAARLSPTRQLELVIVIDKRLQNFELSEHATIDCPVYIETHHLTLIAAR